MAKILTAQLNTLESSSDKLSQRVTPYGMEIKLEERYKHTQDAFKKFLEDSVHDLEETQRELEEIKRDVTKDSLLEEQL